jgi:hypothetical protein
MYFSLQTFSLNFIRFVPGRFFHKFRVSIVVISLLVAAGQVPAATYFIDYSSGADSNNGTSTSTPWKHHPYMNGWTGSYSHSAGDVFVFKRGVTWPSASLGMVITAGGTSGNPDIYESLPSWTTDVSQTNAILDGEYASITFGGFGSLINVAAANVTINGFEAKRLLLQTTDTYNANGTGSIAATYNSVNGVQINTNIVVENCYIHDWKPVSLVQEGDFGGIFFYGSGCIAMNNTIGPGDVPDGYTGSPANSGCGVAGGDYVWSNHIIGCFELVHGGLFEIAYNDLGPAANSFAPGAHCNVIYHDTATGITTKIYNNKIHDTDTEFQTMLLHVGIGGATNTTTYIYNNICWNLTAGIVFDDFGIVNNSNNIVCHVWNNIVVNQFVAAGLRNGGLSNFVYEVDCENNLWINTGASGNFNPFGDYAQQPLLFGNMSVRIDKNNLWLQPTAAAILGWAFANQWQTPSVTSANVGSGVNLSSQITAAGLPLTDISGDARPSSPAGWDAGAYQVVSAAPFTSLTASSAAVMSGQPTTLTWSSINATNLVLNGFGPISLNGSTNITPTKTTTYMMTATGTNGTRSTTILIQVIPQPPSGLGIKSN